MDTTASVSKLKASLSAYLDLVKSGEQIIVTDRGKPIARVIPFGAGVGDEALDMSSLVREGVLRPGDGRTPQDLLAAYPIGEVSHSNVVEALLEERESGW